MPSGQVIAASFAVRSQGQATLFRVIKAGHIFPAFVVRTKGKVPAYLNVCPHRGLRLNGSSRDVFHTDGGYLSCRAHGAGFDPATGACTIGPSLGYALIRLRVDESNQEIVFQDEDYAYYDQP